MKTSAFPMTLELEFFIDGAWKVMLSYRVNTHKQLYDKYAQIKSLYNMGDKEWRMIIVVNSKVNNFLE